MNRSMFRKLIILLGLVCFCFPLHETSGQTTENPPYIAVLQIGRGTADTVDWHPEDDVITVGGSFGVWLYTEDFEVITRLETETGSVRNLQWNPSGDLLAVAVYDVAIEIWDMSTLERVASIPATAPEYDVPFAWSGDGESIATVMFNDIVIWNARSGQELLRIVPESETTYLTPFTVEWSPNGEFLATAQLAGNIRIWNLESGDLVKTLETRSGAAIAWSPDSTLLAATDFSSLNDVQVWNVEDAVVETTLQEHTEPITYLSWSEHGLISISANDRMLHLWDLNSGTSTVALITGQSFSNSVGWKPDGSRFVTSSFLESMVRVWDATTGELLIEFNEQSPIGRANWSPDSRQIVASQMVGLGIWDADTGELVMTFTRPDGSPSVASNSVWSLDGRRIVSSYLKYINVWDVETGQLLYEIEGHEQIIHSIKWHPIDNLIMTASDDGKVKVWNTDTWEVVMEFTGDVNEKMLDIAWSVDGTLLVAATDRNRLLIWNTDMGQRIATLDGRRPIVWSPSGDLLASGVYTGLAIWNSEDDMWEGTALEADFFITTLAWHTDDELSLATNNGQQVEMIDINTGESRTISHIGSSHLAWSSDGERLLSSDRDGVVRIYERSN